MKKWVILIAAVGFLSMNGCSTDRERQIRMSQAHYKLGIANLNSDRQQYAFVEFQKSVASNPKNRDAHYMLGHIYFRRGRLHEAEGEFTKVLKLSSKDPEAHLYIGRVFSEQKKWEKAIEHYQKALRDLQYRTPQYAHYHMAVAKKNTGKLNEALESYSSALKIDPDFVFMGRPWGHVIHGEVGNLYAALDKPDEAIEAYQKAILKASDYPDAHFNMGRVYFDQGSYEKAKDSFEKVIHLDPDGELAEQSRKYLERFR